MKPTSLETTKEPTLLIKSCLVSLLLLCSLARPADGEPIVKADLSASIGAIRGETEYILTSQGRDNFNRLITVKSQLEFPVENAVAGVGLHLSSRRAVRPWHVVASLSLAVPRDISGMLDHDWITIPGEFDGKFSYTESNTESRYVRLSVSGEWFIWRNQTLEAGPTAGIRYQRMSQTVTGWDGWYIDYTSPAPSVLSQSGNAEGIEYRVSYWTPMIGLAGRIAQESPLSAQASLVYTPVVYSDFDDHLLRFKTAEGSGSGHGMIAEAAVMYRMPSHGNGIKPQLRFSVAYQAMSADGNQTQRWYGDDPASAGDDTGQVISGIDHEVSSSMLSVSLGVALGL